MCGVKWCFSQFDFFSISIFFYGQQKRYFHKWESLKCKLLGHVVLTLISHQFGFPKPHRWRFNHWELQLITTIYTYLLHNYVIVEINDSICSSVCSHPHHGLITHVQVWGVGTCPHTGDLSFIFYAEQMTWVSELLKQMSNQKEEWTFTAESLPSTDLLTLFVTNEFSANSSISNNRISLPFSLTQVSVFPRLDLI